MTPPARKAHPPRSPAARAPTPPPGRPAGRALPGPPWAAVWGAALAATAMLGVVAFAFHPVGDYFTESDFYGGYAAGARQIQRGALDAARYVVVGPVYDALLALVGFVTSDLFVAARLLAVLAAGAAFSLWAAIAGRWLGPAAALGTVVLMASNPHLVRYGYSATTDMTAVGLQSASLWLLWGAAGPAGIALAGLCAALATLTRYSAVALVPAAIVSLIWLAPRPRMGSGRSVALFLAAFALPVAGWSAYSLAHGVVPGGMLVRNLGFYADTSATRNVQDLVGGLDAAPEAAAPPRAAAARAFAPRRLVSAAIDHARRDAGETLGWPVAALFAAGLVALALGGRWRAVSPALVFAACQFAILVPVFHTARYSMALAPPLLLVAAAVPAAPWLARGRPRGWRPVLALVALVPIAAGALACVRLQRQVRDQLPVEVLGAGRALGTAASPGARVMSRKGHIGYYSGLGVRPLPRVGSLAALATEARRAQADYLYFSWYEAELRPEFWFLLDTSAVVPGLDVVHSNAGNPAVVYRIGPDFGLAPAWFANDTLRRLHEARAQVRALPDELAWSAHFFLAGWAAQHGRLEEAEEHLAIVVRVRPELATARSALERIRRARTTDGPPAR